MKDGIFKIFLFTALERFFNAKTDLHDAIIEANIQAGIWKKKAILYAYTYNSKLHHPTIDWKHLSKNEIELELNCDLEPDLWVPGGKLSVFISLKKSSQNSFAGVYEGYLEGKKIDGKASAIFAKKIVKGGTRSAKIPILLNEFEFENKSSKLYDFSFAGITNKKFEKKMKIFDVREFGAFPDSGKEARDAVQAAVDQAASQGGGIIYFPPGEFDFSVKTKKPPVFIENSNIIIRGSGCGNGGTILSNHRPSESPDLSKIWLAGLSPGFFFASPNAKKNFMKYQPLNEKAICIVKSTVRGKQELQFFNEPNLQKNKTYLIRYLDNQKGDLIKNLTQKACSPAKNYIGEGKMLISQIFQIIEKIKQSVYKIDSPLHWTLEPDITCEVCEFETISNVIIENLRLKSDWAQIFVHHKNSEHNNGWDHIRLERCADSIVRNIFHDSCTTAVSLHHCKNCLVENNSIIGNWAHNGFVCADTCTNNLFLRCLAGSQMHALSLSGTATGNVFCDCEINEPGAVDFHGGTCLDNLFDRLIGGVNFGGGSQFAVPPRHCQGLVFWNWLIGRFNPYNPTKFCNRVLSYKDTPGFSCIGARSKYNYDLFFDTEKGEVFEEFISNLSHIELPGKKVSPDSLYFYLKKMRKK